MNISESPQPSPQRLNRGRLARRAVAILSVAAAGATVAIASTPHDISGSARATEAAERHLPETVDVVTIHNSGSLDAETRSRAIKAANLAGAAWSVVQSVSSAMTRLTRSGSIIQAADSRFSYPMSTTFLDDDLIATLMGSDVLEGLTDRTLVMSERTADLRGAQPADVVTLRHVADGTRRFTITQIVDDAVIGGTELLMLPSAAARLGVERESRVTIWGFDDRDSIMRALFAAGVIENVAVGPGAIFDPPGPVGPIRLRRSWDPRDPDNPLGMAATKAMLGEFSYRINPGRSEVTVDRAWYSANLGGRVLLGLESICPPNGSRCGLWANCHRVIKPAVRMALAQVAASRLENTLDVADANRAGGCFAPRFNRLTPDSKVGFLSRHAWAGAIDINTIRDCQGCIPPSLATRDGGCETVRIFRRNGFAWGGNYTTPDGMHFEYVGGDLSRFPYPSRWCANPPIGGELTEELPLRWSERSVLFADSGLLEGHVHD